MTGPVIVIGTRGSALARVQADLVVGELRRAGRPSRVVIVETAGDRRAPDSAWGEGAFVAAIEQALLDGLVDVAVHSAKDVPTDGDPRLRIGAYLARADPRDALVVRSDAPARTLEDLPAGARVGTDSPRRTGFLLARRPDLQVHPLHGNVDTRLRRLDAGETDALVLACAGLDRLGLAGRIAQRIDPDILPPAPGQGAIAVQIRADDRRSSDLVGSIDDRDSRRAVEAERAFLSASGGGCRSPIGALATISADELDLLGGQVNPDGSGAASVRRRGPASSGLKIAGDVAGALRGPRRRVIVTRAAEQSEALLEALRNAGLAPLAIPTIAVIPGPIDGHLATAAAQLEAYAWVVVTSPNGARAISAAVALAAPGLRTPGLTHWAAIGQSTGAALEAAGIAVEFSPSEASGATLARELPVSPGKRVLVVRGDLAGPQLALGLRDRGAEVDDVVAYRTMEAPESSQPLLRAAIADGPVDAIVFTSGSTVRGMAALARIEHLDVASLAAVCIGPRTAAEAGAAGFRVIGVAASPDPASLATTVAAALDAFTVPAEALR